MARFAFQILFALFFSAGLLIADPAQIDAPRSTAPRFDCKATVAHLAWTPDQKWEGTIVEKFFNSLSEKFPTHRFEPFKAHAPVVTKVIGRDGKVWVAKTLTVNDRDHREALAREANLLSTLPSEHFVRLQGGKNLESQSPSELPYFWMDYYPAGTLADQFSKLGDKVAPLEMLEIFRQMVVPLDILHDRGYGNGDLKPENYLVENANDKISNVVMTDLGSAARFDDPDGSRVFTPQYLDPFFTPLETTYSSFTRAILRRDMNALRISFQELLLGRALGAVHRDFRQAYLFMWGKTERTIYKLSVSPHTINSKIHEVLSALAWANFPDTKSLLRAIDEAKHAIQSGDTKSFYSKAIYPVLREHHSAEAAARLIVDSSELYAAFQSGKLKLSLFNHRDRAIKREVRNQRRLRPTDVALGQ